jgi:Xaa-Pro aminopeptidase
MQAEYRGRRRQFMAELGQGVAIIPGASLSVMHSDVEFPFRQDSDFFYLCGFNEPESVAVLAPHHAEHQFVLFVQPKNPAQETWTGIRAGVEGAKAIYGADEAYPISELDEKLPQYLEAADRIYYRPGRSQEFNLLVLSHWQKLLAQRPRRGSGPCAIEDPSLILHRLRQIKSPYEIEQMHQAASIGAKAHLRAMEVTHPGIWEYQVQAEIDYCFCQMGALGPAYPSIVASGANACILHYIENRSQLQDGDLLLIDAGCSLGYYNSDITRTFPVNGRFSAEQKALYTIVLEAQLRAIAAVQPGTPYDHYHAVAVQTIVDGLLDLGLLQGSAEEIIEKQAYKPFYMHRTGHWLGLDVHDVGNYKEGEDSAVLQAGQVLTVEPGIYISPTIQPAEGQPEVPEIWRGIGIRIEDDVWVTETGHTVLTEAVPKQVAQLEH